MGGIKKIIGYLGLWHKRDRYHITNIAITEKLRKKGYGENLLRYIEKIGTHLCCQNYC